jgi:hypothetical protein
MAQQTIKAVEMTRQIRDRIYGQMKDMSPAEQLAFFREHARLMNAQAKKLGKTKRKPVHV